MNLVKFNSVAPTRSLFDDLFNDFFNVDLDVPQRSMARFRQPLVNVIEDKDAFKIEMAVPGISKEDVAISLEKDQLVVKASKEEQKEEKTDTFSRKEFYFGNFEKNFYIPETIDKEAIDAHFNDGILNITLPKKEEAIDKGPQHIEVK